MRKLFLIAVFFVMAVAVMAIPAKRVWRTFIQPDGTSIELMLIGDERLHYYVTRDEVPVIEVDDVFYFAKSEENMVKSTGVMAREQQFRQPEDLAAIHTIDEMESLREHSIKNGMRRVNRIGENDHPDYLGHKKGLIILANFKDKKFWDYSAEDEGQATWERYNDIANKVGYTNSKYGAIGSVHDYYYDQSYGKFNLTFDVVGPVQLSKNFSYYGSNANGDDSKAPEMIMECCQLADSLVDFNDYDWDGDGVVEEVFVLYAGYGEATGGPANTIWPHMWTLSSAAYYNSKIPAEFQLDDAMIDVYACSNELYANYGNTEMGLGVICHEFSHCLGLPDFYDTSYAGNYGMGEWDILDSGSYNGPQGIGWVPAGYTSYERAYAGWLKYNELTYDRWVVNQKPLNERGNAYVIYNDNNRNEYFLLENRNKTKWDSFLPGNGLLIIHVDYNQAIWESNSVNTTGYGNSHQRMTVFHASNSTRGGHDAYPYNGNDSLTDKSSPKASIYHTNTDGTKLMHKPVTEIKRNKQNASISFFFSNNNKKGNQMVDRIDEFLDQKAGIAAVYSINGVKVKENVDESEVRNLPKGTYIIRRNDGTTTKMVVK